MEALSVSLNAKESILSIPQVSLLSSLTSSKGSAMTADALSPGEVPERSFVQDEELFRKRHTLPVFKVTLPPPDEDSVTPPASKGLSSDGVARTGTGTAPSSVASPAIDPLWKLDRRDSGSLYWRRDSVANKNSKVKFRCDVDVLEFLPREGEHIRDPIQDSASEDEDDLYDDDCIFVDEEYRSWLRPSNLFGYRRRRRRSLSSRRGKPRDSSVLMSLFCMLAILLTAYVQFTYLK